MILMMKHFHFLYSIGWIELAWSKSMLFFSLSLPISIWANRIVIILFYYNFIWCCTKMKTTRKNNNNNNNNDKLRKWINLLCYVVFLFLFLQFKYSFISFNRIETSIEMEKKKQQYILSEQKIYKHQALCYLL